jgi:hypothetical protein
MARRKTHPNRSFKMNPILKCDPLEATMVEASKEFLRTGEIPDALLQCFDQEGRWLGDTAASEFLLPDAWLKLCDLTIPANRRVTTNEKGESILLTSYMEKTSGCVRVSPPWHEIRGMCSVETDGNLELLNLRRLNPIYSNAAEFTALTIRLPELTEVDCISLTADHISIPKLQTAKYLEFRTTRHIYAPSLQTAGQLKLGSAFSAHFPVLREVDEALVGYAIREFSAPLLEAVNRLQTGYTGLLLPDAWTIDTPNLKHVGKRLDAISAESFCPPGLTVDGTWQMHPNAERIRARRAMRRPDFEL